MDFDAAAEMERLLTGSANSDDPSHVRAAEPAPIREGFLIVDERNESDPKSGADPIQLVTENNDKEAYWQHVTNGRTFVMQNVPHSNSICITVIDCINCVFRSTHAATRNHWHIN